VSDIKIKETWGQMGRRLAVALPQWVLNRLDKRSEGKGFVVKAIPFVIMLLSIASITNLAGRAFIHHRDYSAYATGAGIAVLVPVAVIAAMLIDGWWTKLFWGMAFLFAMVSGTIQYNIYLMPNAGPMGIAEAIAFGFGVPISEVMLAIMETRLVIQFDRKKAAEQAAKEAEIKAAKLAEEARAEAERQRQVLEQREVEARQRQAQIDAENREFERQRKQAELEAYRIELQQKAELERERALADLRIKEQKATAKVSETVSKNNVSVVATPTREVSETDSETIEKLIVRFLKAKPGAKLDDIAAHVDTTKGNVSKKITSLVEMGVLHEERQGNRRVVSVNGGHEQFLAK
jgi:flagellar biosynthesis GTPase FlhF